MHVQASARMDAVSRQRGGELAQRPTRTERWVFGYGSLVWRPAFDHIERIPGFVRGFARRLWQGSPDHRGVPNAPGRVVTLVPEADAICWGMGYRVEPEAWEEVLQILDERESGGFERLSLELDFGTSGRPPAQALVYVAPSGNPNFLGPAALDEMASQILRAEGASGSNAEYVLRLASALRELNAEDDHVFDIAARLADAR